MRCYIWAIIGHIFCFYSLNASASGLESLYTNHRFNCFSERNRVQLSEPITKFRTIDHKRLVAVCSKYSDTNSIFAHQIWYTPCLPEVNRRSVTVYDLKPDGDSIILSQHLAFNTKQLSKEERSFFVKILKSTIPLIKQWFSNHGINYQSHIYNNFDGEDFEVLLSNSPVQKLALQGNLWVKSVIFECRG